MVGSQIAAMKSTLPWQPVGAEGVTASPINALLPAAVGKSEAAAAAGAVVDDIAASIVRDPTRLAYKDAEEIAKMFNDVGYKATVRPSNTGSLTATAVDIEGGPINQIRISTGAGRL